MHTRWARQSTWLSGNPANQSEKAERVLKFAPKEPYIDDVMDGRLYMNAADYYHGLPSEQCDPLEASLSFGMGIYANRLLPIYCMFTVQESHIVDSTVVITGRSIEEFRCADGWIGIVRYGCLERLLDRKTILEMAFPAGPRAAISRMQLKTSKKEGRRINPLQVSPEGFHRN